MKLDLRELPFYYINLEEAEQRKEKVEEILKGLDIKNVTRINAIKHENGAAGTPRSMLKALELAHNGDPFVLLEDDISLKNWDPIIEIPDDTDALYLGVSWWGRMNSHSGPCVKWEKVNDKIVRVYNMLGGHAILYKSDRYIDLSKRICQHAGYKIQDHVDIGFATVQRWHNIYAIDDPYFYQTSCSGNEQGTYGRLSLQQSADFIHPHPQFFLPEALC